MGEVIYLKDYGLKIDAMEPISVADAQVDGPKLAEIERLSSIRDHIEDMMDMVCAVHRDPEAVSMAACRYGTMRLFQLHGRAEAMRFVGRCIETAEIAEDLGGI